MKARAFAAWYNEAEFGPHFTTEMLPFDAHLGSSSVPTGDAPNPPMLPKHRYNFSFENHAPKATLFSVESTLAR